MIKFLVDAQLPVRLARLLQKAGYDAVHTRDLPDQNATQDSKINDISIQQNRIVVTKDADFLHSFLISKKPYKLLLVTTGNITNGELEALFLENLPHLAALFEQHAYIELGRDTITVHQ
jgi:predicted nuclease of predicted toxin-antitoxin system